MRKRNPKLSPATPGPPLPEGDERGLVVHADNLVALARVPDGSVDLVYIDPPFNTGRAQKRRRVRSVRDEGGEHLGFGGKRYRSVRDQAASSVTFADTFEDFPAFLEPRLREARRVLAPHGTLYVHLDSREAHYIKVLLDQIFGRDCFLNELVWAYDYGGRPRDRWPAKHDDILVYVRTPGKHVFNRDEIDRLPYMAPKLVTPEKAARGKLPTDVWWQTIVSPTGKEKTGYPTQKPIAILERIVRASAPPGGLVCDFFAGSGTTGAACLRNGRRFLLVDANPEAISVMRERLGVEGIRYA